jgi:DNA-binding transcriptional LysR family regulator
MRLMHVERVDLNLLPALAALLEERQVSRAAQRMHLSQPAMSRTLQRLRHTFDDDLLVRGADGFVLTSRAVRLQQELGRVLPQLDALFADEFFDPGAAEEKYRLAGSDYVVLSFASLVYRIVLARSPRSSLYFETWHDHSFNGLDDGTLDLAFYGGAGPEHLRSEHLFTDQLRCVVSNDHPLASASSISLTDYLKWPHLVISIDRDRQPAIDDKLDKIGASRRAGLTLPFHAVAPATVAGTPLIATIPARLLIGTTLDGLTILDAPKQLRTFQYFMTWSARVDRDQAHAWLRSVVREVTADTGDPPDTRV